MGEDLTREESIEYEDQDICADVSELSADLSSLMEIDSSVLSDSRKKKLAHMKRMIFDCLYFYCECLPQPIDGCDEQ